MPSDDTELYHHYQILRREDGKLWELGKGAMGTTYKAFDTSLHCEVALKVVNAQFIDSDSARERFLREARAAASLRHPNVASVHHLGHDAETIFYAMELIEGETLDALVRRDGPLPWQTALNYARQAALALKAAHSRKIIHRDIKPANIMLVEIDEASVVKVIDFGLAKVLQDSDSRVNRSSGIIGTPYYASPEQCKEDIADIRSDIYCLGATLWFMLVGHPPFSGSLYKVVDCHIRKAPDWTQLPPTLPASVRALLTRMLEKDPDKRPQTPADLAREIKTCLQDGGSAKAQEEPDKAQLSAADPVAEGLRLWKEKPAKAVELFRQAAALGDAEGQAWLGLMYELGKGGLKNDPVEAVRLYKLSAEQENATGQARLGLMHELGKGGLKADKKQAIELYKLSAEQGNSYGQAYLGVIHEYGGGGLKADPVEAVRLFKLSAEQGNYIGQAFLGDMYENGRGGLKADKKQAIELYQEAAAQGHPFALGRLKILGVQ